VVTSLEGEVGKSFVVNVVKREMLTEKKVVRERDLSGRELTENQVTIFTL